MDPPDHTNARSLLNRLLTPSRLKENEDFMWRLADEVLDDFIAIQADILISLVGLEKCSEDNIVVK